MRKSDDLMWRFIQAVCWIIFLGFCIQGGTLLFTYVYSFFNPGVSENLYLGLDHSQLYKQNISVYMWTGIMLLILVGLKAFLFYLMVQLFRMLNRVKPFSREVSLFLKKITQVSFYLGVSCVVTKGIFQYFTKKGFQIGFVERFWSDGSAFLMMSAILFVIALIFKKGVELQEENDLTV